MTLRSFLVLAGLATCAVAQTTYTLSGCHKHGGTEYCYLPNGSEVPFTRTGSAAQATAPPKITAPATTAASSTPAPIPASVTACHTHDGGSQFCQASGTEYEVLEAPKITPLPGAYNGCHGHGSDIFCMAPDGSEVPIALEGANHTEGAGHEDTGHGGEAGAATGGKGNCHFHGTVEHCTGGSAAPATCDRVERNYNIPLRIGLIFVILVTSGFAVFAPMLIERFSSLTLNSIVFTILKQFGTGIIISTAFVHLLTHAEMQFANECLGELKYEGTTTAIAMAGVFLSFLIEYIGSRLVARRNAGIVPSSDAEQVSTNSAKGSTDGAHAPAAQDTSIGALGHAHSSGDGHRDSHFSVAVMESGIVFHSILIGITLNVTPNSWFTTLFIVIIFHQMFEGLALGTRIASLKSSTSFLTKSIMATVFTLITPIGMAIGVGVLKHFNGNDPATIVAIGTLDALSAGILLWVGLVEMLAHDWMGGDMSRASRGRTVVGGVSLVAGMVLMSVLGKWA
ncbi:related to Fe2+/Zn2+ regulated transporter [Rhynchosporium secalis]|uniref:Related to Fe2+/Zn2+ regulated transporter n=1 Tax=Rhynchosporium secalis TaxID=38038 RepID=A0A1E1MU85_RHYSE|nr:related to Fe2+/Zn2+ regulated transporter [Rhynchosporium secalis]